jgi:hypothetical protein
MEHISFWSVYVNNINILGKDVNTIKEDTGLLEAARDGGLEVNTENQVQDVAVKFTEWIYCNHTCILKVY